MNSYSHDFLQSLLRKAMAQGNIKATPRRQKYRFGAITDYEGTVLLQGFRMSYLLVGHKGVHGDLGVDPMKKEGYSLYNGFTHIIPIYYQEEAWDTLQRYILDTIKFYSSSIYLKHVVDPMDQEKLVRYYEEILEESDPLLPFLFTKVFQYMKHNAIEALEVCREIINQKVNIEEEEEVLVEPALLEHFALTYGVQKEKEGVSYQGVALFAYGPFVWIALGHRRKEQLYRRGYIEYQPLLIQRDVWRMLRRRVSSSLRDYFQATLTKREGQERLGAWNSYFYSESPWSFLFVLQLLYPRLEAGDPVLENWVYSQEQGNIFPPNPEGIFSIVRDLVEMFAENFPQYPIW